LSVTTPSQDTYQVAGLDPRERGFSRPAIMTQDDRRYRASLRYESVEVVTAPVSTQNEALQLLIATLHAQGYRQLKTQISFQNGRYLGSSEPWIEYADPPTAHGPGVFGAIRGWFQRDRLSV
jgi:hypothetical protein